MAKKKLSGLSKMPKWAWWALWVLGIIATLFVILYASFQIWLSTWKTYRNDEFGFSFRYPGNWYISGNPINKDFFDSGRGIFWIDQQKLPESDRGLVVSQGDVEVHVSPDLDFYKGTRNFSFYKTRLFGNRSGLFEEDWGISAPAGGVFAFSKEAIVKTESYVYGIKTVTFAKDTSIISTIIAKFYYLVASNIIDGFKFD